MVGESKLRHISKKIDRDINAQRKVRSRTFRMLLDGMDNSGKSTLAKQIKIIFLDGFIEPERMLYIPIIAENIVSSMKKLIQQVSFFGFQLSAENEKYAQKIMSIPPNSTITQKIGKAISMLWDDIAIQQAFKDSDYFKINHSLKYFASNLTIGRITSPNYIPTETDIANTPEHKTGVEDIVFEFENIHNQ